MNTVIAYVVAFLFIGAIGSLLGSLLSLGWMSKIGSPAAWSLVGGATGAILAYWIGLQFFQWLGVHFGWYSYLASMIPVILNDGRRSARDGNQAVGIDSSVGRGTLIGIIASLCFMAFGSASKQGLPTQEPTWDQLSPVDPTKKTPRTPPNLLKGQK